MCRIFDFIIGPVRFYALFDIRVCLKNARRLENARFGTCTAGLFGQFDPIFPPKVPLPGTQNCSFQSPQYFEDTPSSKQVCPYIWQ